MSNFDPKNLKIGDDAYVSSGSKLFKGMVTKTTSTMVTVVITDGRVKKFNSRTSKQVSDEFNTKLISEHDYRHGENERKKDEILTEIRNTASDITRFDDDVAKDYVTEIKRLCYEYLDLK